MSRIKNSHFIIPDTQVKKGVPLNHLTAAGNYIVVKKPDVIIHLGDHWDMPSLSTYDVGTLKAEGGRYNDDVKAGQDAMDILLQPIRDYNTKRAKNKKKQYNPRMVFLMGNHENRINRAINQDPKFLGKIAIEDLDVESYGWEVYEYQEIVEIDGILYSHNFVNTDSLTKNIIGGTVHNKLSKIGQSFTMGHQQTLQMGMRYSNTGRCFRGLVAGAFYQHDEAYMGLQGNHHWRGCVMCHEVHDGNYSVTEVSLEYLLEEYL